MSDAEGSNEEDLDKLLNDWDDVPKVQATPKPKPKLATTSKPRPTFQRQASNTEDEDEPDPEVKPLPGSDALKSPVKKPSLGMAYVPITSRPKANPNANLLGNVTFGTKEDEKGPVGKKPFMKGPNRPETVEKAQGSFLKTSKPAAAVSTAKSDLDWLGIGSDSPMPSANTTPLPQRKDLNQKGSGEAGDPFDKGLSASVPLNFNSRSANLPPEINPAPSSLFSGLKQLKSGKPIEQNYEPISKKPLEKSAISVPNDFATESGLPSFLDKLTSNVRHTNEFETATAGGDAPGAVTRKKVVTVRKPGGTQAAVLPQQVPTLQVPSHIIDEEELKRMFMCQKQLYESQVTMLEKAYKDQIDCVMESYSRKEEMLKEEIKMVQKDSDDRVARLKGELAEAELRPLQFRTQNQEYLHLVTKLSDQLKDFHLENAEAPATRGNASVPDATALSDSIGQLIEVKLGSVLAAIDASINQRLSENNIRAVSDSILIERIDLVLARLDSQSKFEQEAIAVAGQNQDQVRKTLEAAVEKVMKEQKKLREMLIKSTVTNMTQSLESKHEDQKKKEKISFQIREFRREFQRLLIDLDQKQDNLRKSQTNMEGEQKHISQLFQELSTWLHLSLPNQTTSLYPQQSSVQNEMELKLLKDERNALSEAIAQMNVEKRKLHDERIQMEAERRDFERQRHQIQDLETTLRVKISDAEETKKVDASRSEHIRFSSELSRKMTDLEKERIRYRDMTQTLELTTGIEKQRQAEEHAEIIREREFLDKLRLQFLCPSCLRLVRSQGDGHDTQASRPYQSSQPPPPQINVYANTVQDYSPPELDLERKGNELKTMIANYYGNDKPYQ